MSGPIRYQTVKTYPADAFCVSLGANMGDPADGRNDPCLGDIYILSPAATELTLRHKGVDPVSQTSITPALTIAPGSDLGAAGDKIRVVEQLTLMGDDGATLEVWVLDVGGARVIHAMGPVRRRIEYTLLKVDRDLAPRQLADAACVSFTRGTHITMANGRQQPVEDLRVGDRVLTRDHGPQPIRWIGQQTVRAHGDYAPVVITKGTLNNSADLILSPDHRLFVYQRRDALGLGQSEVLVRARHLINHDTIYQRAGGFVDYFHVLFDEHEIIFAEGIQAESLMVSGHTMAALPQDLAAEVTTRHSRRASRQRMGIEADMTSLTGADPADLLRRASGG